MNELGGECRVTDTLRQGRQSRSSGVYILNGGLLKADTVDVAMQRRGDLRQQAGTHTARVLNSDGGKAAGADDLAPGAALRITEKLDTGYATTGIFRQVGGAARATRGWRVENGCALI